ncbi:predicted protein [Sclerotinia sclerotiorum 1980 UF-70]|uniref:Uncharacterized protein n=1 Tax=Sclerotinia sclerotiorum (strain ATCC 18683 / 1980 / Ss-1) TaxID=665079 RepID=A7EPX6_SCLS1|nr:predicted protein [Sclerotinia sclerotiorum 1980 UF-70]EDO04892.1 predicted protein [Sclerotinia sclerotiorum 1980 UF-70]
MRWAELLGWRIGGGMLGEFVGLDHQIIFGAMLPPSRGFKVCTKSGCSDMQQKLK